MVPKEVRCAIYTRKSTEDGLEQEINSLEAQRLAGENFILSHQQEGWKIVSKRYDDGGYSGKDLKRPALQELFKDIQGGEIDCIVVYKIDRLARSLLGFSKIVEILDENKVTFVIVTQPMNTTTSTGRLILNILLSFAQFEREITIDRVKDKIAISKKRGLRMGGRAPIGYDIKNKGLVKNEEEAKLVRKIFELFEKEKSVVVVARNINKEGYRTKKYQCKTGKICGKQEFRKTAIRRIIINPVYVGKIKHEGKLYKGQHEGIISEEQWNRVQELIENQPRNIKKYEEALLKGVIRCHKCNIGMTSTYTRKENKKYRYYVCYNHVQGKHCLSMNRTIAAGEIEREVKKQVRYVLENTESILEKEVPSNLKKLNKMWKELFPLKQQEIIKMLVKTVWIREEGVELLIGLKELKGLCKDYGEVQEKFKARAANIVVEKEVVSVLVKMKLKKQASRCMILIPENKLYGDKQDDTLLKGLIRAHLWQRQIKEEKYATTKELCEEINIRHIQRILRLNYLAPKIKEDILNGTQPRHLRLADLKKMSLLWSKQYERFYGEAYS